jgi:hypothetical protein
MRGIACISSAVCSCTRTAAGTTSCARPAAILTARAGKLADEDVAHMLGATQPVAVPSPLVQLRQSARDRVGAVVRVMEFEPYCTPICPPGELGRLAVEGDDAECICAALSKERESTMKGTRTVFLAFMGLPLGSVRGRAVKSTLTRKKPNSNENLIARAGIHSRVGTRH